MRRFNDAFLAARPESAGRFDCRGLRTREHPATPNGSRHVGRAACLEVWRGIAGNPAGWFEPEQITAVGERAIIQWRYCWGEGDANSIRGVNLMRVRDGLTVEGQGYVQGA